ECRFGRVGKLVPLLCTPASGCTLEHEAFVYSILAEGGSTARITAGCGLRLRRHYPPRRFAANLGFVSGHRFIPRHESHRNGRFRIIEHLPCQPPWTRLSPPHASASPGIGEAATCERWSAPPPGTRRADFEINCGGWHGTESPPSPN